MNRNYEFYMKADLGEYTGKWVAIVDNKIVSTGKNAKEVYEEAVKKTKKKPLITKVPDKESMIL